MEVHLEEQKQGPLPFSSFLTWTGPVDPTKKHAKISSWYHNPSIERKGKTPKILNQRLFTPYLSFKKRVVHLLTVQVKAFWNCRGNNPWSQRRLPHGISVSGICGRWTMTCQSLPRRSLPLDQYLVAIQKEITSWFHLTVLNLCNINPSNWLIWLIWFCGYNQESGFYTHPAPKTETQADSRALYRVTSNTWPDRLTSRCGPGWYTMWKEQLFYGAQIRIQLTIVKDILF